jgi:hypothetical protein
MQILPNAPFPIVYVISDPSDVATYYVRSVVRNSATGAIIKINNANFVNLTVDPTNSRRFSKLIQSPIDVSGNGFFIDVTTTVYTDSGYTTKSQIYQEDNVKYLVLQPWTTGLGLGGGGWKPEGGGIDWKKIKELILEAFNELPTTELPNLDLSPVLIHTKQIKDMISEIPQPEKVNIDLESHTKRIISAHEKAIKGIEFPEQKEVDLSPISDSIEKMSRENTAMHNVHIDNMVEHIKNVRDIMEQLGEKLSNNQYVKLMGDIEEIFRTHRRGSNNKMPRVDIHERAKQLL